MYAVHRRRPSCNSSRCRGFNACNNKGVTGRRARSAQLGKPREFSLAHSRRPIEFHLQRTGRHTRLLRMARGSTATLTEARAQLAPAVPVRREVLPDLEGQVRPSLADSRRSRPWRRGGPSRSTSEWASWLLQPLLSPSVNLTGTGLDAVGWLRSP